MKNRKRGRPVGKCRGCSLNLRTVCALGLEPHAEWSRGRCRARADESLLEEVADGPPLTGAEAARQGRRAKAAITKTVPHYDGLVFAPARRGGTGVR